MGPWVRIITETVCVVGLGYVGLPLAVEFAKNGFHVIGFDVDKKKVERIRNFDDPCGEVDSAILKKANVNPTADEKEIRKADFVIVAVPTPIYKNKDPDMSYVLSATRIVGKNIKKGSIVVYESTVYPGATEEECVPILEKESGMKCGTDFKIGYSPERINPGDKEHTIDKIKKIVSGMDKESLKRISALYSKIIKAGVYEAPSIKVAEAAKVVENTQRDLNIALVNELSLIFNKMDINTRDVIEAAGTKWNFHKYYPGLVGGHCISVDPHYLLWKSKKMGYDPKVILAGRDVNDYMPIHVAKMAVESLKKAGKDPKRSKVLILGLTFKEDIKDTRNSKIKDMIVELKKDGLAVYAYDPNVDKDDFLRFEAEYGSLEGLIRYDCVILARAHKIFQSITIPRLKSIMAANPVLVDIRSFYNKDEAVKQGFIYRTL